MKILVTGSSGYLGAALVEELRSGGHSVRGIDVRESVTTTDVVSVTDRNRVAALIHDGAIEAIIHTSALHKPHIRTHDRSEFVDTNICGTLNLLEESVGSGSPVRIFLLTSTTSLMVDHDLHESRVETAQWITEEFTPKPRNIYGITKLTAEGLCQLFHRNFSLPILILRTSRFFPELDDRADSIEQSDDNAKINEYLFRRIDLRDVVRSHVVALERAEDLGLDTFIISAPSPFQQSDCRELMTDARSVVQRYVPQYGRIYERLGWSMFAKIDRVYVSRKAEEVLGFVAKYGFEEKLGELGN